MVFYWWFLKLKTKKAEQRGQEQEQVGVEVMDDSSDLERRSSRAHSGPCWREAGGEYQTSVVVGELDLVRKIQHMG